MEQNMLEAHKLQAEGRTQKEIAEILGVTDRTVRNYLREAPRKRKPPIRTSKLDPYREFIRGMLKDHPRMNGELILEHITRMGYTGKRSIMKAYLTEVRKELALKAVIRFETEPGFQAQVDWKECGYRIVDGKRRKLYAFVMTLGYSRMLFVRYTTDMKSATLLACHIKAFEYFGGIPEEILYDNMKTAFVFDGEVWRPATRLAAFACHYRFIPRRCRVRRPETKGKVERSINYLEKNFHQRLGEGRYRLDELNEEALRWIDWIKGKPISGLTESREERFCHERGYLKPIPAVPFEIRDALPVMVNRESCITYRTNRYSVPPRFIGKQLIIRPEIGDQRIDVYANAQLIRTIALLPEGSHLQMFDPIDREAIRSRWEHDRDRQTRERLPRKRTRKPATVDVAVRHPAFYDLLVGDACNG